MTASKFHHTYTQKSTYIILKNLDFYKILKTFTFL